MLWDQAFNTRVVYLWGDGHSLPARVEHVGHESRGGRRSRRVDDVGHHGWEGRCEGIRDDSSRRRPSEDLNLPWRIQNDITGTHYKRAQRREKGCALYLFRSLFDDIEHLVEFRRKQVERGQDAAIGA